MQTNIIQRRKYLDKLMSLAGDSRIKVIYGIIYEGKTVLIRQLKGELLLSGVLDSEIATISFDKNFYNVKTGEEFYSLMENCCKFEKGFLLIDSANLAPDYRTNILNFRRLHPNISIYVTISTNIVRDGEYIPNISDYIVPVYMYPLSFREILEKYSGDPRKVFEHYVHNGGMPFMQIDIPTEDLIMINEGFYHIVLNRLIMKETKTNPHAMGALLTYLLSNLGKPLTMKQILANSEIADNRTLEKYLQRILDSRVLFLSEAYQMDRGMKKSAKLVFHAIDTLMGSVLNSFGLEHIPRHYIISNIVFIELKRRGYDPDILLSKGAVAGMRISLPGGNLLIRVDESVANTMNAEGFPGYRSSTMRKVLLTLDENYAEHRELCQRSIIEFLLTEDIETFLANGPHKI